VTAPSLRPGPSRARRAVLAFGLATATIGPAACSVRGEVHDAAEAERTSTTAGAVPPTTGTPGSTSPTTAPGVVAPAAPPVEGPVPDPSVDDVPDEVFPDLGDPRIDVATYDLTVRADPGREDITGRAVLTLSARTAAPLSSFTLDLRGPAVTRATVAGAPATVDAQPSEITIRPAEPLAPGRATEVILDYAGVPQPADLDRLGTIGWHADDAGGWFADSEPLGTSTWAPVNDHPSDKATWRITLDTPDGITGVSNGHLVSRGTAGDGRRRWVWEQDRPMAPYLAFAAVGRYELVERTATISDHPVRILVAMPADKAGDADRFDRIEAMLTFFAERFGPYLDDDAGAIVVPTDLGLALETQSRPMFGDEVLFDAEPFALAHELAHEWFGNAVTPARWIDLWLNEGFATYSEYLWFEHDGGYPLRSQVEDDESRLNRSPLAPVSRDAADDFDPAVYGNGARALYALQLTIGDADFATLLRRWVAEQRGGTATTEDFVALAEDVSGRDLSAWARTWLHDGGHPPLPG
jgi:aminopeptidase N